MPARTQPATLIGGNSVRTTTLESYIFDAGLEKPTHSSILSFKFPQYYMTALLDRLGSSEGIGTGTWSWDELDRTREGGTVSSLSGTGSTTITFEITEWAFTATDLGYAIVGDLFRTEGGKIGRVTAVVVSTVLSAKAKVTIFRVGGGNWAAGDIADTELIGHISSSFVEASSAPNGRLYLPVESSNVLTIIRRSFAISGTAFTNRIYLGDGRSWYFTQEDIEMKEFARDQEGLIMFGQASASSEAPKVTEGILQSALDNGTNTGYVGATGVSEVNLQDHIKAMVVQGVSNELTVLCGAEFLKDVQRALVDYAIDGALSYGQFGANTAGLDFHAYKFMGKTINFVYYEMFNDVAMVPAPINSVDSVTIDFDNFSLWLDMGTDSTGQRLITLKYKELNGQSRRFIHAYEVGMMNPEGSNGGFVSNGDDKFTIHYLAEIGIEVRLKHRLGVLRATS